MFCSLIIFSGIYLLVFTWNNHHRNNFSHMIHMIAVELNDVFVDLGEALISLRSAHTVASFWFHFLCNFVVFLSIKNFIFFCLVSFSVSIPDIRFNYSVYIKCAVVLVPQRIFFSK